MNILKGSFFYALLTLGIVFTGCTQSVKDNDIHKLWLECKLEGEVSFEIFNSAIVGYHKLDIIKKKNILTIIDFSKPSTEKRFFVIDIEKKQLLYKCLVAHGKNTGENIATNFSNQAESLKSSLGFF